MRVLDAGDDINIGLMGFWPLDEAGGGIARDISPYRRHAARNTITSISGPSTKAALTTGAATSNIAITSMVIPSGTPLTITWLGLMPNTAVSNATFGAGTGTGSNPRLLVHWPFSGTIYWDYGNDSTGRITTSASGLANQWHVWSFVNNGTNRKEIWKDGIRVASSSSTASLANSFTGVWFGAGPNGTFNNTIVQIAACRVHFRALQPSELTRLGRNPWAGTLKAKQFRYSGATAYNLSADGIARTYSLGAATLTRGYALSAEGVARRYSFGAAGLHWQPAQVGDTHDGFVRRSRRERALEAAAERARQEWITERNALRLSLEAAMGYAAEVVEGAPDEAVAAVEEAAQQARVVLPTLARKPSAVDLAAAVALVERLQAATEEAARLKALAEDDEEVLMLLRAL